MRRTRLPRLAGALALCVLVGACGSGASAPAISPPPTAGTQSIPAPARGSTASAQLLNWPEFGLDPQRSDVSPDSTGITAANVAHLRRLRIALPGTVDSSPIYLHDVGVAGAMRDVAVLTTIYGRTLALDAGDGRILWTFTAPRATALGGTAQITTTSPLADPDREFVYAASPDRLIRQALTRRRQRGPHRALGRSRSHATPPTRSSPPRSISMVPTSSPRPAATSATPRPIRATWC